MASTVKCFNLVLSYKGNKYKGHKWILAFLKLKKLIKRLIKGLVKNKGKRIREKEVV